MLKEIYETVYRTSKGTKGTRVHQTDATKVKAIITEVVEQAIQEKYPDLEMIKGAKGTLILIPNQEEGFLPFEMVLSAKPLDIDIEDYKTEYEEKKRKEEQKLLKKEILKKKEVTKE